MKNEEKYKTPKERLEAFDKFCKNGNYCSNCPLADKPCYKSSCTLYWLALEAEEEKPMPCPFCSKKFVAVINHKAHPNKRAVECYNRDDDCCYRGPFKSTEAEAVAAHNRVCRAVEAAKEEGNG